MKIKNIAFLLLSFLFTTTFLSYSFANEYYSDVKITINDKVVDFEKPIMQSTNSDLINKRDIFIPLREIFEKFGYSIEYENLTKTIIAKYNGNIILLTDKTLKINNINYDYYLYNPLKTIDNSTYIATDILEIILSIDSNYDISEKTLSLSKSETYNANPDDISVTEKIFSAAIFSPMRYAYKFDDESIEEYKEILHDYIYYYSKKLKENYDFEQLNEKYKSSDPNKILNDYNFRSNLLKKSYNLLIRNNISSKDEPAFSYTPYTDSFDLSFNNNSDNSTFNDIYSKLNDMAKYLFTAQLTNESYEKLKNIYFEVTNYCVDCAKNIEEIKNNADLLNSTADIYNKYIEQIKSFAVENRVSVLNKNEYYSAEKELSNLLMTIIEKYDTLKKPEQYDSLIEEISVYMIRILNNSQRIDTQEKVDIATENFKKYIEKLKPILIN